MCSLHESHSTRTEMAGGALNHVPCETLLLGFTVRLSAAAIRGSAPSEEKPDAEDTNNSLDDAARDEQDYLRARLRKELKREPSEEEMNEWLRQHTEGY